jgi:hypothetical protein
MLMGITEYAQHRGCRLKAVQIAIKNGRIERRNGLIDSDKADADWARNTDASTVPLTNRFKAVARQGGGPSFMSARTRMQIAVAELKELELGQRRGELVERTAVEAAAFQTYRQLRDACFGIPDRLCAQLAAEQSESGVRLVLEQELRGIFTQFADGVLT